MMQDDVAMVGWTIYYRPLDFPDHFAVRMWMVGEGSELIWRNIACVCRTLEEAREQVPTGTVCMPREDEDDPVIVESWI
jgi:hypothetical protein